MSEMIERVAMAIRRNKFERTGRLSVLDPTNITAEELGEARAAIEAMREPTEEMEAVIWVAGGLAAEDVWPAMIDAALKEKSPAAD